VTRWNRRLLFGAIALLVPALAGCEAGLNAPTLEFHQSSSGVTVMQNGINIDNAFVLGPELNATLPVGGRAGMFVALQSANGDRLVSVSAPGTASSVQITGAPLELPSQSLVDLQGPSPEIVLSGLTRPLVGGETIQLDFLFATAGVITLQVPVEPQAYTYATYSPPPVPTPTATPSTKATGTGTSVSASSTATPSPSATP
jgi:copper(I)-binding protein